MEQHDFYPEVERFAESLNRSGNEDWEWGILAGCPSPLTRDALAEIARWWATEATSEGQTVDDAVRVSLGLTAILRRNGGAMEINTWTLVTESNIEAIRQEMPCDQGAELEAGAYCITILDRGQEYAAVTVFPNHGRFMAAYGADPVWGGWSNGQAEWIDDDGEPVGLGLYRIPALLLEEMGAQR